MKCVSIINTILLSILLFLMGILIGDSYQRWHISQINIPPTPNEQFNELGRFMVEFYRDEYCRGMPVSEGTHVNHKTGEVAHYLKCGLPKQLFFDSEGRYSFMYNSKDDIFYGRVYY